MFVIVTFQRPHVPQFGNWDSQENVPYTRYFDNARKGRGGKMINPNDPEENPEMFRQFAPPAPAPSNIRPQTEEPVGRGAVRAQHEYRGSREDGNFRQFVDSPARTDNPGRRTSGESTHHNSGRPTRHSAGSEHSFERSPLHSHHPAKLAGRGGTSPAWDGKSSHDSSHGTYGKSRMKQVSRVEESVSCGLYFSNLIFKLPWINDFRLQGRDLTLFLELRRTLDMFILSKRSFFFFLVLFCVWGFCSCSAC